MTVRRTELAVPPAVTGPSSGPASGLVARVRTAAVSVPYTSPIVIVIAALFIFPLGYGLYLSLHKTAGVRVTDFVGADNYVQAVSDTVLHRAVLNTLLFTAGAVVLQTGIGFVLAVLISEVRRGRTFYRLVFFAPFVLAPVAVGAVWKWLYEPYFGPISTTLTSVGLAPAGSSPLAASNTALAAIMVAFLWRFVGFNTVVYLAAIQRLPPEVYEAAQLDGVGWVGRTVHLTWPLLRPQTFTLVLLTTVGTLHIFDMMWIMTGGGPDHATETVSTYLYLTAFRFFRLGYGQSIAFIQVGVVALLAFLEYRYLRRRMEAD